MNEIPLKVFESLFFVSSNAKSYSFFNEKNSHYSRINFQRDSKALKRNKERGKKVFLTKLKLHAITDLKVQSCN